jgi:membrane-associated protease RseP (regulator of RpoE activity)
MISAANRIRDWLRAYLHRLNTGVRPAAQPPEVFIEPSREVRNRPLVNLLLFIVTFFTTTFAGASDGKTIADLLLSGLPYSLTLLGILLSHEFGHYAAARKFGVRATLPYFIPFPSIIGTMGAVIKTRSPIPNRRALLYIGAMGPIPGFIVSLAAAAIGIYLSDVRPLPAAGGEMIVPIYGDSMIFALLIKVIHGSIPAGHDLYLSQYAWAGWIGLLITSLNLMPIGQLDGSHILYALIGRRQRIFGWASLCGLVILAVVWQGWIVWIVLTLLVLMVAHPEISEQEKLAPTEKAMGCLCMIILVLTFVPIPVKFL